MSSSKSAKNRPDYGIDAPTVVRTFFVLAAFGLILGGLAQVGVIPGRLARHFATTLLSISASLLGSGLIMLWGSRVGKLRLRDKLITDLPWRGDEQVLDVGCGHGLMLIAAAKRLTTGQATGIDIWQNVDQAGNSEAATLRNVEIEEVSSRVRLMTADARSMPFADGTFDVILSSWALHNIYAKQERAKALAEIVRVLKPGGRVVITDIRHAGEYASTFRKAGFTGIRRSLPSFVFLTPTFTVTALKPVR